MSNKSEIAVNDWDLELASHSGQYLWELYWPESKLTKSDINWKKVKHHYITCLFSWIKEIWVSHPHHSPPPFHLHSASCHILVHVKSLRSSFGRIWGKQVKTPPLFFFQNKNYFTKTLPILLAKMVCLIKKNSTQMMISCVMWCLVIQDLSGKFIYWIVLTTLLQLIQHSLSMINGYYVIMPESCRKYSASQGELEFTGHSVQ